MPRPESSKPCTRCKVGSRVNSTPYCQSCRSEIRRAAYKLKRPVGARIPAHKAGGIVPVPVILQRLLYEYHYGEVPKGDE